MVQTHTFFKKRCGFSLLELLAVVTLIGILASIVLVRISESVGVARQKTCVHNKMQLNSLLERFVVNTGSFATSLSELDTNEYLPGGLPVCEVTGTAYSLNTTTNRIEGHTLESH